ncbi:Piso0_003968 [Millerozyma farinosa CBS 7064]|uniref:Ribosome quality control complex subunit 2 n=1 Tax=Pichia sorbitophila (strain ATCC MYA-4447 / BCRC 22081 / CBS 7064 / NBRC 10061 / NRRL Y-12695) TaxID=559304 RepID=G8YA10_PICSO|nr:Piso0_003968 [Millerozyma farinosa CBS 7064]CCE84424.1 Piso0_003968 [Millerozyma farinosa CBS 7064]
MKQRVTGLDLQILCKELQEEIVSYRLQNVYGTAKSNKQYILKFSVADSKKLVALETGNRIHLTEYERATEAFPSSFVTKMRKHLKSRRLTGVKQVANDRVLVLEFSDGAFYLALEFFSAGNIILLDENLKILSLQRTVQEKGGNDKYAVNETYSMFDKSLFQKEIQIPKISFTPDLISEWIASQKTRLEDVTDASKKKKKVYSIHKLLFVNASHLSGDLILRSLVKQGINPSSSCFDYVEDTQGLEDIVRALQETQAEYLEIVESPSRVKGCIVMVKNKLYNPEDPDSKDLKYIMDEFHPYKPHKENEDSYQFMEVEGYNKTLDTYFSTIESSRYALRIEQQKEQARKRLEKARNERDKQIQSLLDQKNLNIKKGEAIIYHADVIEECKESVLQLIRQQMDWENIEKLIQLEQTRGNKLAQMIKLPLNLVQNKINVLLTDPNDMEAYSHATDGKSHSDSDSDSDSSSDMQSSDFDSDDSDYDSELEEESRRKQIEKRAAKKEKKKPRVPLLEVSIDLSLSSFANSRIYFDNKKNAETKQAKVEKNTEIALRNAEKKINRDLSSNLKKESETLKQIRPKFWFEKFYWFVSNEGYLCLAGNDDTQTDMIYYRHFNDNDYFVTSDIEGSLKVFVKNPYQGKEVSPSTLTQAGIFSMSASKAWDNKITTSAWYLKGSEVSKKDFDGSLVSFGNFNYKGEKQFLPPSQLVMGLAFYFLGDEETTQRYRSTRLERQAEFGLEIVLDNKKADLVNLEELAAIEASASHNKENESTSKDGNTNVEEQAIENERSNGNSEGVAPDTIEQDATPEPETGAELQEQVSKKPDSKSKGKFSQDDDDVFDPIAETLRNLRVEEKSTQKGPKVRGKKMKLQKAAKYADQDEEDRRLRMEALGTWKQVQENKKKRAEGAQNTGQRRNGTAPQQKPASRRSRQELAEYRKYVMSEINDNESSVVDPLAILDSFIGTPTSTDKLCYVVPVFAPWSALSKLKYKVKIQPGNMKKGKCVSEVIHALLSRKTDPANADPDLDWAIEHEYLAALKPADVVSAITTAKTRPVLGAKRK